MLFKFLIYFSNFIRLLVDRGYIYRIINSMLALSYSFVEIFLLNF